MQQFGDAHNVARRIQIARGYIAFRALFGDVMIFIAIAGWTVKFREIDPRRSARGKKNSFNSGDWMTPRQSRGAPRTGGDAQMATPRNLIAIS